MRKVYPDKNKFASQGYGHRFDLIPSDIDDTNKNIPIRNLPLPWLTKINSIFSELASFKYRPSSWNEHYADNLIFLYLFFVFEKHAEEKILNPHQLLYLYIS